MTFASNPELDRAIEEYADYIGAQTLALEVIVTPSPVDGAQRVAINDTEVDVAVVRV